MRRKQTQPTPMRSSSFIAPTHQQRNLTVLLIRTRLGGALSSLFDHYLGCLVAHGCAPQHVGLELKRCKGLQIKLNPAERTMTVSGTKRRNPRSARNAASSPVDEPPQPASDVNDPVQDKTPAYRMFERQVGPFSRSVTLPHDADLDDITARSPPSLP